MSAQKMVTVCERYGREHNLVFSTDPIPARSKTKCMLFCGRMKVQYPAPVILDGKELPCSAPVCYYGEGLSERQSQVYRQYCGHQRTVPFCSSKPGSPDGPSVVL